MPENTDQPEKTPYLDTFHAVYGNLTEKILDSKSEKVLLFVSVNYRSIWDQLQNEPCLKINQKTAQG